MTFGVVVLAAGKSTRFGTPKQLALFRGKPLLSWICNSAISSGAQQIVLVLNPNLVSSQIAFEPRIEQIVNPDYEAGMASSIRVGVSALRKEIEIAVIVLADQPLVPASHLVHLVERLEGYFACASEYPDGSIGVPAAFGRGSFQDLLNLQGDSGAKSLLKRRESEVARLCLADPLDIDEPEDLDRTDGLLD